MSLPKLIDCKGIQEECGVSRATAEAIMRALPKVTIDGHRKVFVKLADLEAYIADRTLAGPLHQTGLRR